MTAQDDLIEQAKECHRNGDLDRAVQIYQGVLEETPDCADALAFLGAAYLAQNRLLEAETALRDALRQRADHAPAHDNLGIVQAKQGKYAEAAASFREALRWQPHHAETHANLGQALLKLEKWDEAAASLQTAVRLNRNDAAAYKGLAEVWTRLGKRDEAVTCLRQLVRLKPRSPKAHFQLAMALAELEKFEEAATEYREVLRLNSQSAEAYINLGNVLKSQGKYDEAIASYEEALRLQPDRPETLNNLGAAFQVQGRLEEARAQFERVRLLRPDLAETHNNLGSVLAQQGHIDEALASYGEAMRLKPDDYEVHYNLALALIKFGRLAEAQGSLRRALELKPDYALAHVQHAMVSLQLGDFKEGWAEYEWRWRCKEFGIRPGGRRPTWDGSPLDGRKILLHAEQGLGDTIQFIRYAALVKKRGGVVLVACPKALVPLLSRCPAVDQCVAQGTQLPEHDLEIPLLSLPRVFGTSVDSVPARVPYLFPDPGLVDFWKCDLQSVEGFKIGIAWQGNPQYKCDRQRSIPLCQFAPLADVAGVRLISLQKGLGTEQLPAVADRFQVLDLGSRLDETAGPFMDTAAVMVNLDLIIAADTAVAHLAGALGVQVWLALSADSDWRWIRDREDSPWYPATRLFRQTVYGDWDDVFRRMAGELQKRLQPVCRRVAPLVEVPVGDLIDKITILEIKNEWLKDPGELENFRQELQSLENIRRKTVPSSEQLIRFTGELKAVNETLWIVEDDIRRCERENDFGPRFIELARTVYRENDRRCALKRQINELLESKLIAEKSYQA